MAGGKSFTRAAASSIASGSPSSRRQISATVPALSAVTAKVGKTARARSVNNRPASDRSTSWLGTWPSWRPDIVPLSAGGSESGGTGNSRSPDKRSGARLVTSTVSCGQATSSSPICRAASRTCSQLSSTSSRGRARSVMISRSTSGCSPASRTPTACAMVGTTRWGSVSGARATNATPSAPSSAHRVATSIARRVLPTPPGPVSVSNRTSGRRRRAAIVAASCSRPTSAVSGRGGPEKGTASRTNSCTGGDPLRVTTARLDALLSMACAAAVSRAGHTITAFPQPGDSTSVAHWASDQRWTTTRLSSERLRA